MRSPIIGRPWTPEEDAVVQASFRTLGAEAVAKMVGRTAQGVRKRAQHTGVVAALKDSCDARCAKLVEISKTVRTIAGQASAMGMTLRQTKWLRHKCVEKGLPLQVAVATKYADGKLADLDAQLAGPGCGRCGLRGPHVCSDVGLVELVSRRSDPLGNEPTWDEESPRRVRETKRETVNMAAMRHRITPQLLEKLLRAEGMRRRGRFWWVDREVVDRIVAEARKQRAA